ncbi:hypothetical protein G7Y89_g1299 [Cudoniella acicularis]|uniref:Uncharacterized protein n=1 Tax=Cudoniella acicularis TaxID=354080 RepID=A0A8H4RVK7_9HELO|nr:hypothetical protein G7Y89_g1299 [Cudoniella acicularis]
MWGSFGKTRLPQVSRKESLNDWTIFTTSKLQSSPQPLAVADAWARPPKVYAHSTLCFVTFADIGAVTSVNVVVTTQTLTYLNLGDPYSMTSTRFLTITHPTTASLEPYLVISTTSTVSVAYATTVATTLPPSTTTVIVSLVPQVYSTTGLCFIPGQKFLTPCTTIAVATPPTPKSTSAAIPQAKNPLIKISHYLKSMRSGIKTINVQLLNLYNSLRQNINTFDLSSSLLKRQQAQGDDQEWGCVRPALTTNQGATLGIFAFLAFVFATNGYWQLYRIAQREDVQHASRRGMIIGILVTYLLMLASAGIFLSQVFQYWFSCKVVNY